MFFFELLSAEFERESPRSSSFHLNEIRGRENRAGKAKIHEVFAIVAGRHHPDRYTNARSAGLVSFEPVSVPVQISIGKIDRELLGRRDIRSYLEGEIRLVLPGEHLMRHLVEHLSDFPCMVARNAEENRFADFSGYRIPERILHECFAEFAVGFFTKKFPFETGAFVYDFFAFAGILFHFDGVSLVGKELSGYVRLAIDDERIDQVGSFGVFHSVEEAIPIRGFP